MWTETFGGPAREMSGFRRQLQDKDMTNTGLVLSRWATSRPGRGISESVRVQVVKRLCRRGKSVLYNFEVSVKLTVDPCLFTLKGGPSQEPSGG
jgi:hypothetical protein